MEESLSKYRMAIAVMLGRVADVTPERLTEECLVKGPFPEGQVAISGTRDTWRHTQGSATTGLCFCPGARAEREIPATW